MRPRTGWADLFVTVGAVIIPTLIGGMVAGLLVIAFSGGVCQ